jgi:hypothetical protein
MVRAIKKIVKRVLPQSCLNLLRSYQNRQYRNRTPEQIFTEIYETGRWGISRDPNRPFYSGSGSNRDEEVSSYVEAVGEFLSSLGAKPDVVDIGCGDFAVGSQIRKFCGHYTGCDVVPSLIEFNKSHFRDLDVEFRALNLADDSLPLGEVAFVRQVLQHLSNDQIARFVAKAPITYKHLVITEHHPAVEGFKPNLDKPAGHTTRMGYDSGVVLTAPPFNLRPRIEKRLCQVNSIDTGILVTTLYSF